MIVRSLTLEGFRNYKALHVDFHPQVNLIYGDNAQGKTNLLEAIGLLTGGMVSAGYLCLFLEEPLRIVTTLLLAVIVHGLVLLISRATILYSRRRFMVTMLLSLIFAWIIEQALLRMALIPQDIRIIGHVVPGLIANDMYKQGVFKTLLGVLTSAAIVRLLVMVVVAL